MKKREVETRERKYTEVKNFSLIRVNQYKDTVYFDMEINGVTINGCRVVESEKGDFIGFPSRKGVGKDGKEHYFYNAYVPLDEESQHAILMTVEDMLNER